MINPILSYPLLQCKFVMILTFSEVSEIDSFLVEGSEEGEVGPEPEYLLPRTPPLSPASPNQEQTHDVHLIGLKLNFCIFVFQKRTNIFYCEYT